MTFIKKSKGILITIYKQIANLEHLVSKKELHEHACVPSKERVGREARSPVQFPFYYIIDHDSSAENDISFFVRLLLSTFLNVTMQVKNMIIPKKSC